jgi:putative redox protein
MTDESACNPDRRSRPEISSDDRDLAIGDNDMTQVSATLEEGMVVTMSNGRHAWTADEPASAGGTDTGPNPYELLLGSLAACTCITLSWYCKGKDLPLESVRTTYELSRVHADDCADCDIPQRGFIERVSSSIHIEGDFTEAQRKRLAQVAERCPVHKTLAHGLQFDDNVTFVSGAAT